MTNFPIILGFMMRNNNIAAIDAARRSKKAAKREKNKESIARRYAASSVPSIASPMPIDSDASTAPFSPAPTTPDPTIFQTFILMK